VDGRPKQGSSVGPKEKTGSHKKALPHYNNKIRTVKKIFTENAFPVDQNVLSSAEL
jgi:hypothetical protein